MLNRIDDVQVRAAKGDPEAVAYFFSQNMSFLNAMARRIGGGVLDHEDLVADAIAAVLSLWAEGKGPSTHINAYIITAMRNRVTDELRSPRSRLRSLDQHQGPEPTLLNQRDEVLHEGIDFAEEAKLVMQALQLIPEDQKVVLLEMTANGVKPRELEAKLGRPANAISSLHRRAKISLRKSVFSVVMSDGAPKACAEALKHVPEAFPDHYHPSAVRDEHFVSCSRCQNSWGRFGALATAFGIIPLLVVGHSLSAAVSPASALTCDNGDEEARKDRVTDRAQPNYDQITHALAQRLFGVQQVLMSKATGALLLGAGSAIGASIVVAAVTQTGWFMQDPPASFQVQQIGDTTAFDVAFEVEEYTWANSQLSIDLPPGGELRNVPAGWRCGPDSGEVLCETDEINERGGLFVFEDISVSDHIIFELTADLPNGRSVIAMREVVVKGKGSQTLSALEGYMR